MKIRWLGHSMFLITSNEGKKIVLDPYQPGGFGGGLAHGALNEPADVVVVSHEHLDHNYVQGVPGNPMVLKGAGKFVAAGIEFQGIGTYHDRSKGAERGRNTVFVFTVDGVKVCHLGDLGHVLTAEQAASIGVVDVLLAPVGGTFTIGPVDAAKVAEQLAAKIVIPIHYKTPKVAFPVEPVDSFLKGKANVESLAESEIEIEPDDLKGAQRIIVLQYAL